MTAKAAPATAEVAVAEEAPAATEEATPETELEPAAVAEGGEEA